jgi:hypothetical protein
MPTANRIKLNVFEVLKKVADAKEASEKISLLKSNDTPALRTILQGCYNPNIKLNLPETDPPYTPNQPQSVPYNLLSRWKDFGYFVGSKSAKLGKIKTESIFIQLLEAIHPEDAKVVLQMKSKKPFDGLDVSVVREAFPKLLPS